MFELDDALMEEILFFMENQDGNFVMDTQEAVVLDIDNYDNDDALDFDDDERFISLPGWSPQDGYRLMEHFAAGLRNPVVREELSAALNRGRGVFRSFKNVLEQYPETEKQWFKFKDREMKNEVIAWYNSIRESRGLELIGPEPEDTSSLILEDFAMREGNDADFEKAASLHKLCVENDANSAILESMNPFAFPGDLCFIAETAKGDFAGCICTVKKDSILHVRLEITPEYRGLGLGKALLAKLLEKTDGQVSIDLPSSAEGFSRALHLEGFKPCVQRYIKSN
ncbi:MAG: UPF0158 family protein [Treponema sp.]|nr:UPF0158 family protein [Treponema sp.]